jgi:hypothetical protein
MQTIKFKKIIITILVSLLIFSIAYSFYASLKSGGIHLGGLVLFVYYLIPVTLFVLVFSLVGSVFFKLDNYKAYLLFAQIVFSLLLAIVFFTLWVVFIGSWKNYRGIDFTGYWLMELGRYWVPVVYFGVVVPLFLAIINRNILR